jgi:hypothetical protein
MKFGNKFGFKRSYTSFWDKKSINLVAIDFRNILSENCEWYYIVLDFFKYIFIEINKNDLILFIKKYKPKKSRTEFYIVDKNFTKIFIRKYTEEDVYYTIVKKS